MSTQTPRTTYAKHSQYQVLGTLTVMLGVCSTMAAAWILYSSYKLKKSTERQSERNRPVFLTNHVFWMSCCDVAQQAWLAWSWLSVAVDGSFNSGWDPGICSTVGVFAQFFLVGSAAWNFVIAICLMRILLRWDIHQIQKELPLHHTFVWLTALTCTVAPLAGGAYGYTHNVENDHGFDNFECWIKGGDYADYQMCLYGPAIAFVFFAGFLLLYILYALKTKKLKKEAMTFRLTLYTFVFVGTWTFPIALRFRGTRSSSEPPPFLVWMHHISLTSIGLGNAYIWGTSGHSSSLKWCTSSISSRRQAAAAIANNAAPEKKSKKGAPRKAKAPTAQEAHTNSPNEESSCAAVSVSDDGGGKRNTITTFADGDRANIEMIIHEDATGHLSPTAMSDIGENTTDLNTADDPNTGARL